MLRSGLFYLLTTSSEHGGHDSSAEDTVTQTSGRRHFLDGLRCIAVCAVVAQHFLEDVYPEASRPFLELGPGLFGVALFFMISGYVIPLSLTRACSLRAFALRRMFRILPMYWVTLGLVMAMGAIGVVPFESQIHSLDLYGMIANAMLVFEYTGEPALVAVSWSLSLEFVWYGTICFLLCIWGTNRAVHACLLFSGVLIFAALMSVLMDQRLPFGRLLMLNAAFLGYARFGYETGTLDPRAFRHSNIAFVAAAVCTLWVGFGYFLHPSVTLHSNASAWIASYLLFSTICASKFLRELPLWKTRSISHIGLCSYSIYLLHDPVASLLFGYVQPWALIICATALTVLLASLAVRFIEIPFNLLGRRVATDAVQNSSSWVRGADREQRKF